VKCVDRNATTTCLLHCSYNGQRENFVALQPPRQCPLVLLAEVVCVLNTAAESEENETMGGGLCWYAAEEGSLLVAYVFRLSCFISLQGHFGNK
jgi:hypothetical protein